MQPKLAKINKETPYFGSSESFSHQCWHDWKACY